VRFACICKEPPRRCTLPGAPGAVVAVYHNGLRPGVHARPRFRFWTLLTRTCGVVYDCISPRLLAIGRAAGPGFRPLHAATGTD
jgi:hypothetical protein